MIRIESLYRATNEGLDIILHYYPQAREVVGTKNKFRVRAADKTPSACLYLCHTQSGEGVWKVTDFGDEGHAQSPLDICMREEGIERPYEAVLKLAAMFDVRDELNRSINKPDIKHRPAKADEKDGTRIFALLERIPEAKHLKVLGPRVTHADTDALHWYEAEYVGYVKNREVTLKYSTENYPIFMRECVVEEGGGEKAEVKFYKIYEPLNPDKGFRFSYHPAGGKPKAYINGLHELKQLWRKMNADEEAAFYRDPANEGKPYHEQKLKEAFICSGERDSLCCHSMGYSPLWFNSETYRLSEAEYKEVMKYVEVLYNIPDLDSTGVRKGRELALRFIDIHTIWLPQTLTQYRDNRGRPRKDLRDWQELRDRRSDFAGLMALAMPAKFWTERTNRKTGAVTYDIDTECLYNFLRLNGFYTLHDNIKEARYIHVQGNIVREVKAKDLRHFISEWAEERCLPRPVRNLIHNSPRLSDSALDNMREVTLDFTNYTPTTQLFFFPGKTIEATPTGLVEHAGGDGLDRYVWQENVLDHRVTLMPPMFEVERSVTPTGEARFGVKVKDAESSPLFGYVINTSRVHWRKELEYNFAERDATEAEAYHRAHKFCIDGEGLTPDEQHEQEQNLASKLFAIGYMLHHYKSPSRAWAPMAMDNKIGEDGECNGRSGKSFLFKALSLFMKTVKLSGRNAKLMDNPHVFDQVTQHTDFVLVDDCDRHLDTGAFYDLITSDMTVNPKNNQSYTIPFEQSPKFGFTTNYVPRDFSPSTEARLLYLVFSDYYHQRTEGNDYLESRSIRDDFGRDLISSSYKEEDWNADINFFMQCCQFYLSMCQESIKPMPPMGNILKRKFKADMGTNFEEWANVYFAEEGDHLDAFIVRREAYDAFIDEAKVNKNFYTMNKFTKALRSFAALCPYVYDYNPADLLNSQGRISRRIDGKSEDMIYLRSTKSQANREQLDTGAHLDPEAGFVPDESEG